MLSILALFSGDRWTWTVEEAAQALGLPTSTAYRYFKSLAQAELISARWAGAYVLGAAVCEMDRSMRLHDPFISAAAEEMRRLAVAFPETTILLARLYKHKVMCVHREGTLPAQGYERGLPMPLERGAASKVVLAHLSARELRALPGASDAEEPVEAEKLRAELRKIRANGYSITRGEIDPGKVGISVPVFRNDQTVEGSLSFVIEAQSEADEDAMVKVLIRSGKAVEANLLIADYRAS